MYLAENNFKITMTNILKKQKNHRKYVDDVTENTIYTKSNLYFV